jgi:hypothetical protein
MARSTAWMRDITLDRYKIHTIEAVVDRLVLRGQEK